MVFAKSVLMQHIFGSVISKYLLQSSAQAQNSTWLNNRFTFGYTNEHIEATGTVITLNNRLGLLKVKRS